MKYLIPLILAILGFVVANLFFTITQAFLISIIVLMVAFWTNEALPLGVISLFPIILFPLLGILDIKNVSSNYSNPIIFLFLGGFLLAIAVEKINLHKVIANKILSIFPPKRLIFALALTSAILSAFLSNTTTALLLLPIALYLSDDNNLKLRLVLAIAYGASIGGIITPIGTPPNLILLGFLEENNLDMLTFIEWMLKTIPLAIIMLFIASYILSIGIKNIKTSKIIALPLDNNQKKLSLILILMMILLLGNSFMKIPDAIILLGFGLVMFMPKIGFLEWEDSKKIPYEIIFLFGAGFSIAKAFSSTHLANEISTMLLGLSSLSPFLLLLVVATIITFTTEITSNTALISIALPIIYAMNVNETLLMLSTICASYAFMLPIATPPNAIAFSSGVVKIKTMAKYGFMFNIIAIILTTIFAYFIW